MENQMKKDPILWNYIGKFGILIALIWGCIQIYNYAFTTKDYQYVTEGNHSFYETSPIHVNAIDKAIKYKAVVRTIINSDGQLTNYNLDTLVHKFTNTNNRQLKNEFDSYISESSNRNFFSDTDYDEIWTFKVKNSGIKPFEELSLEVPFEGSYKIILPNNIIKNGDFKNKISIGELRSSYEAQIICWTNNDGYIRDDEDKSRFTHKFGWFGIKYPVQVTGFTAWNEKNNEFPFIVIIGVILIVVFGVGVNTGIKSYKEQQEKDRQNIIPEINNEKNHVT